MTPLFVFAGAALVLTFVIGLISPRRPAHHRHTDAYRTLHSSPYWRELREWIYSYRAHGHCEHCGCPRQLAELQLHCLHYGFLDAGTWPLISDVVLLCAPCHHLADARRRASSRRRGRRR